MVVGNPDEESAGRRGAQVSPALLIGQVLYNEDREVIIKFSNMEVIWNIDNSSFGEMVGMKA